MVIFNSYVNSYIWRVTCLTVLPCRTRLHPLGCGDGPSFLTQDHGLPLHLATAKPRSNILVSWDYDIPNTFPIYMEK